jgi:hypothetical protein
MGLKLIGIAGKARSGKDTFANFLVEEHGFYKMAFANPVKAAASVIFDWPLELVFKDEIKEWKSPMWEITGREAFQKLGTEAIRGTFGDDFWVKRWACDYIKVKDKQSVVVSDVRSDLEAEVIRGLGGVIVHMERGSAGLFGALAAHSSEAPIKYNRKADVKVNNNGNLEQLGHEAGSLVAFIERYAKEYGLMNKIVGE